MSAIINLIPSISSTSTMTNANAKDTDAGLTPIPQPPALPFLGNVHQIDREVPAQTFELLRRQYGEIYKLQFPGACQSHIISVPAYRAC
jgi:hypothetical protein